MNKTEKRPVNAFHAIVRRDSSRGSSRLAGVFRRAIRKETKRNREKRKTRGETVTSGRPEARSREKREDKSSAELRGESVVPLIALIDDTRRETPRRLRACQPLEPDRQDMKNVRSFDCTVRR